jgi:hypothetical protein
MTRYADPTEIGGARQANVDRTVDGQAADADSELDGSKTCQAATLLREKNLLFG